MTRPAAAEGIAVSVDVVIFRLHDETLETLLIRRGIPPFKGKWAIPGGFVHADESLDTAARRELYEETGLKDIYLEQLYTFGDPKRDPRGRVVTVAYVALLPGTALTRAGDDAAEVGWHPLNRLPEVAFDHKSILQYALQRLRYKLEYTAVGFQLLPSEFTLSELQAAYEIVLGEGLDKRNFRRRLLDADPPVVEPTGRYRSGQVGPCCTGTAPTPSPKSKRGGCSHSGLFRPRSQPHARHGVTGSPPLRGLQGGQRVARAVSAAGRGG
jgi:8-oxo-dGTP diphosphatase